MIVGSLAMRHWWPDSAPANDADYICTFAEFQAESRRIRAEEGITICVPLSGSKWHIRNQEGWNYEFEIAWPGSSAELLLAHHKSRNGDSPYASAEMLLALKLSHRYLRNSPHFLKTMRDIQFLRSAGVTLCPWLEGIWLPKREKETYVYDHPNLNVSKQDFFTDSVGYTLDHDSIHLTQALIWKTEPIPCPDGILGCLVLHRKYVPTPAYTYYMKDGEEVSTSKEKFFGLREESWRLYGVYEEACVLALERSQVPHAMELIDGVYRLTGEGPPARWSFMYALQKVCTSITSGWFREYAWENYDKVVSIYDSRGETDYVKLFLDNQALLRPYEGGAY